MRIFCRLTILFIKHPFGFPTFYVVWGPKLARVHMTRILLCPVWKTCNWEFCSNYLTYPDLSYLSFIFPPLNMNFKKDLTEVQDPCRFHQVFKQRFSSLCTNRLTLIRIRIFLYFETQVVVVDSLFSSLFAWKQHLLRRRRAGCPSFAPFVSTDRQMNYQTRQLNFQILNISVQIAFYSNNRQANLQPCCCPRFFKASRTDFIVIAILPHARALHENCET